MNVVAHVSELILAESGRGLTLEQAALRIARRRRSLCLEVMEIIGSWPSSEPELAALQAVWHRSCRGESTHGI